MPWQVVFFQSEWGDSPVAEFLEALSEKARAKCLDYMLLLEERGNRLPSNYASRVQDDLGGLRPEFGGIEYRYFYFTYVEDQIVIAHAISKKSQRLKPGDTRLALSRVEEVRRREAAGLTARGNRESKESACRPRLHTNHSGSTSPNRSRLVPHLPKN